MPSANGDGVRSGFPLTTRTRVPLSLSRGLSRIPKPQGSGSVMAGKAKARCVQPANILILIHETTLSIKNIFFWKKHAHRSPHLDRANRLFLYHAASSDGSKASRGQIRSTGYVCLSVRPVQSSPFDVPVLSFPSLPPFPSPFPRCHSPLCAIVTLMCWVGGVIALQTRI
jgi:hypothetical protein